LTRGRVGADEVGSPNRPLGVGSLVPSYLET
jgi:hypothetical protein